MKKPSVYKKEQIIEAAFELLRGKGWDMVTARAIAKRLGSSTMPIYSHVRSVDELILPIRDRAKKLLKKYQQYPYTEYVLLNLAFGYVTFARDEKNLFRFLYLEKPHLLLEEDKVAMTDFFIEEFGEGSAEVKELFALESGGLEKFLQYNWIFTHGLAMLVNAGTFKKTTDEAIISYLKNAGAAFFLQVKQNEEVEKDVEK